MTVWLRLTMLAWVTAVLAVVPGRAALSCQTCCAVLKSADAPVSHCEKCVPTKTASCCTQHSVAVSPTQPCHECPKCEQSRPVPVVPVPASPELTNPDLGLVFVTLPQELGTPSSALHSTTALRADPASPSDVCARLCRWLT